MMIGVKSFFLALMGIWEEFFTVLVAVLGLFLMGLLLLLPVPLALMGNYVLAHRIADERAVKWRDWWEGGKRHWKAGYGWSAINVVVVFLLLFNIDFWAAELGGQGGSLIAGFWLTILFVWLGTQLYVLPLYLMQKEPALSVAMRNGAVLAITDPLTTLAMLLLLVALYVLAAFIAWPLLLFIPMVAALAGTHAVRQRLQREGLWKPDDIGGK